jgi:hypothetical protein
VEEVGGHVGDKAQQCEEPSVEDHSPGPSPGADLAGRGEETLLAPGKAAQAGQAPVLAPAVCGVLGVGGV